MHQLFGEFNTLSFEIDGLNEKEPVVPIPKSSYDIIKDATREKLRMGKLLRELDASVSSYYGFDKEEPARSITESSVSIAISVPKIDEGNIHVEAQLLKVELTGLNVKIAELKDIISREIELPVSMIHLSGRTGGLYDKRTLADYKLGDHKFGDDIMIFLSAYNNHTWAYSDYDPNPDPSPKFKHITHKNYLY